MLTFLLLATANAQDYGAFLAQYGLELLDKKIEAESGPQIKAAMRACEASFNAHRTAKSPSVIAKSLDDAVMAGRTMSEMRWRVHDAVANLNAFQGDVQFSVAPGPGETRFWSSNGTDPRYVTLPNEFNGCYPNNWEDVPRPD